MATSPTTATMAFVDHPLGGASGQAAAIYAVLNLSSSSPAGGALQLKLPESGSLMTSSVQQANMQLPPEYDSTATSYRSGCGGGNCNSAMVTSSEFCPIVVIESNASRSSMSPPLHGSRRSDMARRGHVDSSEAVNSHHAAAPTSCYVNTSGGRWLPLTFDLATPSPTKYIARRDSEPFCHVQPITGHASVAPHSVHQSRSQSTVVPPPPPMTSSLMMLRDRADLARYRASAAGSNPPGRDGCSDVRMHTQRQQQQQQASNSSPSSGYETMTAGAARRSTTGSSCSHPLQLPLRRPRLRNAADHEDIETISEVDSSNL